MNTLNLTLFERLNAAAGTPEWLVMFAHGCAVELMWLLPALLIIGWLRGGEQLKQPLLEALIATLLALAISGIIGVLWPMPRPFAVPVGTTLMAHAPTPAFPSNHLTIILTMAFSLMLHRYTRRIGSLLLLMAIPVGWARIFLGVHFPQDMAGAALLSAVMAVLVGINRAWLVLPVYEHVAKRLYHWLFAPLIRRGWVQR
ncbi:MULTISPECIES: undecaprenyl-diphosphatase [Halomonas]|uniref:undecaprenyl-diphosphate phosphatase n=1 Tax=Halomonas citrativorans TaxID=2742612 RepID=A0ABR9FC05_9GAMM|nr:MULTISPECIES: undecaprenyl-diphosphatase [Halomonas]MBE0402725.1 undecaprenyl-diphosphatase [Halomonas citrativorans]HCR98241.1 undecaprenyl-diphosphatase [Halomonas sp.]